jgi:hypothetical protein
MPLSDRGGGLKVKSYARDASLPWRLLNVTGVVVMENFAFAARSHIGGAILCTLAAFGLAGCDPDGSTSTSTASTVSSDPLVSPSVGVIDRSTGTTQTTTPPSTATTTPPADSTTTSGSTTVASGTTTPPVNTVSTGTATLDWTPPTQNSDGSTLTNLAGYTVYYGTSPDQLTESVKLTNPGLTAYTLSNLPAGTWYFAVTSYSSTGAESTRTVVISAKI